MGHMSATDTYTAFYGQLASYAPLSMLSLFLLTIFRLAPIIAVSPFLGSKLPANIKMGLCVALAFIMLPHVVMTSKTAIVFNLTYITLLAKEFMMGIILAVFSSVPFYMAQGSGVLIDFARGSSSLQVNDPFTQTQASDLGILYNYIMIVIFYEVNGFTYFFDAVMGSFDIIPADGWINPAFFSFRHPFWETVWHLMTKIFAVSIQLAAPSLLAILMTELFLGIANRLAPQVQIAFLGMSLKSLAGLAMLAVAWVFIVKQLGVQLNLWLKEIPRVIQTMNY